MPKITFTTGATPTVDASGSASTDSTAGPDVQGDPFAQVLDVSLDSGRTGQAAVSNVTPRDELSEVDDAAEEPALDARAEDGPDTPKTDELEVTDQEVLDPREKTAGDLVEDSSSKTTSPADALVETPAASSLPAAAAIPVVSRGATQRVPEGDAAPIDTRARAAQAHDRLPRPVTQTAPQAEAKQLETELRTEVAERRVESAPTKIDVATAKSTPKVEAPPTEAPKQTASESPSANPVSTPSEKPLAKDAAVQETSNSARKSAEPSASKDAAVAAAPLASSANPKLSGAERKQGTKAQSVEAGTAQPKDAADKVPGEKGEKAPAATSAIDTQPSRKTPAASQREARPSAPAGPEAAVEAPPVADPALSSAAPAPKQNIADLSAPAASVAHVVRDVAAAAPASPLRAPEAPNFDAILERIRSQAKPGVQRISFQVEPPQLGRLNIRLVVRGGQLHGEIKADSTEVARTLRDGLDAVRQSLSRAGVDVATFEIKSEAQNSDHRPATDWSQGFDRHSANGGGDARGRHSRADKSDAENPSDPRRVETSSNSESSGVEAQAGGLDVVI